MCLMPYVAFSLLTAFLIVVNVYASKIKLTPEQKREMDETLFYFQP